jgi:hypothetical protein
LTEDSAEPDAEPYSLTIGINSIITLEVTRQAIKIPVTLFTSNNCVITEKALIDSGAGGNFIDTHAVERLNLTQIRLSRPIVVRNVDGTQNSNGTITHRTQVDADVAGRPQCLSLLITKLGNQNLILGLPWLDKENPDINWRTGTLSWRPTNLTIVGDNNDKKGSDFTPPYLSLNALQEDFVLSLAETFEEPSLSPQESCLDIYKMKLSEQFEQTYGTKEEPQPLLEAYKKYAHVFNKKAAERLPKSRPYDHEIHLKPDFKPCKQPPYSLNPEQQDLVKKFIKENLEKGYIEPSKSPMGSPMFFVGKKDGKMRPCQDYRELNTETIKDAFPLLNINGILNRVQRAKWFALGDVFWGFNNILIKKEHRELAAFTTPFGHYQPKVMFFGLCNSPATFQRIMTHYLGDFINENWCFVYMDDILIIGETREQVRERTLKVLKVLSDEDLYLKIEKCKFEVQKVDYLGFTLTPGRVEMDRKKLAGINDWPSPKTLRQV